MTYPKLSAENSCSTQLFLEHLLYARHSARCWNYTGAVQQVSGRADADSNVKGGTNSRHKLNSGLQEQLPLCTRRSPPTLMHSSGMLLRVAYPPAAAGVTLHFLTPSN